jgi:hypothetical protein
VKVKKKLAVKKISAVIKEHWYNHLKEVIYFKNPEKLLEDNSLTERLQKLKQVLQTNDNPPVQELKNEPTFSFEHYLQDRVKDVKNQYCGKIVKNKRGLSTRTISNLKNKKNEPYRAKYADSARIDIMQVNELSNSSRIKNAIGSKTYAKYEVIKKNIGKSRCMNISTEHVVLKNRNNPWRSTINSRRAQNVTTTNARCRVMERSNSMHPKTTVNRTERANSIQHNEARGGYLRDMVNRVDNRRRCIEVNEEARKKLKKLKEELMQEKIKQNKLLEAKMKLQKRLINTFHK